MPNQSSVFRSYVFIVLWEIRGQGGGKGSEEWVDKGGLSWKS